jgi:molybdopterin converting factor small subunit
MITVLFFAAAKDAAKTSSRVYENTGSLTIGEFSVKLLNDIPPLEAILPYVRFAVNGKLVDGTYRIADGDEIAVLPPVSGG